MFWLTDVHIHLSDEEFSNDIPLILTTMKKLMMRACCVSIDLKSSKATLELGKKSNLVMPFVGIHPQKALEDDLEAESELIQANSREITGIGEIGLDKTYVMDSNDFKKQEVVFNRMLSIAEKLKKPVSIHSRTALDEILSILPSYSISGSLLHWFAGSKKQLRIAMDHGCFVSYGPTMVYAKDKQVLLAKTDTNRILVETDGPVQYSRCFGLKSGQISFLQSVVFCAANVLHKTYDDMLYQLEQNCKDYLGV